MRALHVQLNKTSPKSERCYLHQMRLATKSNRGEWNAFFAFASLISIAMLSLYLLGLQALDSYVDPRSGALLLGPLAAGIGIASALIFMRGSAGISRTGAPWSLVDRPRKAMVLIGVSLLSAALIGVEVQTDGGSPPAFSYEPFALGSMPIARLLTIISVFAIGSILSMVIFRVPGRAASVISIAATVISLALFAPRLATYVAQADATVFVDELLAPANERWPLADYYPQYTNLLGWPLVGIEANGTQNLIALVGNYVGVLQAITLIALIAAVILISSWRFAWLPILLIPAVSLMQVYGNLSIADIWSNLPNRLLLPSISFLFFALALRTTWARRRFAFLLLANLAAGLALLNNSDFGIVSWVAALVTTVLIALSVRDLRLAFSVTTALAPALIYASVLLAFNKSPNLLGYFSYLGAFTADSTFLSVFEMPTYGWPLVVLATFAAALGLSAYLILTARRIGDVAPGWSIGLAYLAMCGIGFFTAYATRPAPIVATALLPFWGAVVCLLAVNLLSGPQEREHLANGGSPWARLPMVALTGALAMSLFSLPPWLPGTREQQKRPLPLSAWVIDPKLPDIPGLEGRDYEVVLPNGNLLSLTKALPNSLQFNSVLALVLEPLRSRQCEAWQAAKPRRYLIWLGASAVNPRLEPFACDGATASQVDDDWLLIEFVD